jgi:hypothetical protein
MDTQYNIIISIKTPQGMLEIGDFFIGDDEEMALATFYSLDGYNETDEKSVLRIDLVKKQAEAPEQYLAGISCTLNQYVENCRIIVRDAFKYFTLER